MGVLKKNVFLVGFMGVGKTTVARRMARDMGVACVDVDAYLERKHGKSASEIFGEQGELSLRRLEFEALSECIEMGPAIISCGEGIVAYEKSRNALKRQGFAVMLESSEATSLGRIRNLSTRPLLAHECDIEGLWERRKPLYEEVARAKINVQNRSTGSVADFVAKVLARAGVYVPEEEDAVAKKIEADAQRRRKKRACAKSGRRRSASQRANDKNKKGKSPGSPSADASSLEKNRVRDCASGGGKGESKPAPPKKRRRRHRRKAQSQPSL